MMGATGVVRGCNPTSMAVVTPVQRYWAWSEKLGTRRHKTPLRTCLLVCELQEVCARRQSREGVGA